jgi:hypothetical protein
VNQWSKPRESSATCRIWWMGRSAVLEEPEADGFSAPTALKSMGGGRSGPRLRCAGRAMPSGCSWAPIPSQRTSVNVGSDPVSPFPASSLLAGGQVQRPLLAPGRGGAAVVLRGRESRPHGEGRQRDKQQRCGRGGRC